MRHIVLLSAIALSAAVTAAQAAPATIEGSWRGSGIVSYRNGADNAVSGEVYEKHGEILRGFVSMRHRERPL
jgi:hypothetical protein